MKAFLQSVIDKLNAYLSGINCMESSMRLYAFIIITVACLCLMVFTGFVCANILKVNLSDAALFVGSLAAFAGTGLAGKYLQTRTESKNTIINTVANKVEDSVPSTTAANISATGDM